MKKIFPALLTLLLLTLLFLTACQTPAPDDTPPTVEPESAPTASESTIEATSLLGEPLHRPDLPDAFVAEQQQHLDEARARLDADPGDADALVWAGRRTAYLGRYGEAIEIYGQGIERHPEDARFLRHRGHRYLSTRHLDEAIADFERATQLIAGTEAVVEPDGLPNALGIPTSTLHDNIWYHLGLAHYLQGNFEAALAAYEECQKFAGNPDMLVATTHWHYMTLRRLGREDAAKALLEPIHADLEIIENHSYHHLLMLYKEHSNDEHLPLPEEGEALDQATIGYGAGNWEVYNGRPEKAAAIFREEVLADGPWAAFGYLAAEADLARLMATSDRL